MIFNKEKDFEDAVIKLLTENGWEKKILEYPTEKELINNWAKILFENNRQRDCLNEVPLIDSEMQQILDFINEQKTPLKLNSIINGKSITIKRENKDDNLHFGKEVSLKIFDKDEIIGGSSRYQIARQPEILYRKNELFSTSRGDLMLLINGMPLYHIELKRSNVSVKEAVNQIKRYLDKKIFNGIYSLVQIFVAMTPEETLYFANPYDKFNEKFLFHWADVNNNYYNHYDDVISNFLSIPIAHQMIGYYTVGDKSEDTLKVMRSYQYYAANGISTKVSKVKWDEKFDNKGGYIWHTTGSGKTMTSFKTACLIASTNDADKVIFLVDRIELANQSFREYQNFSDYNTEVQETENTNDLTAKLKNKNDILIVTSIQKMNILAKNELKKIDLEKINQKRIVFIVDECHRSTFGEMLTEIKKSFTKAIFFGFTGTPIHYENSKKDNTTTDLFGDEIHRYSIHDGIKDGNVLGFDPIKVETYKESDLRKIIGLKMSNSKTVEEAYSDPKKKEIFNKYQDRSKVLMYRNPETDEKGIECYLGNEIYNNDIHRKAVVGNILENFIILSQNRKYHAILATSSIEEAIKYYELFKSLKQENKTNLKFTALFDKNIDNKNDQGYIKEEKIVEILSDYNSMYQTSYSYSNYSDFKKDVCLRLARKKPYNYNKDNDPKNLDIIIVVDQLLTGYDSKFINTIYLDKVLHFENIIQAFSRTNRIHLGNDKPHGIIKYYRKPNTMSKLVEDAFKLYSGDKLYGVFVEKLPLNILKINALYDLIKNIFISQKIYNFERLPETKEETKKFSAEFRKLYGTIEAAKLQGFLWSIKEYSTENSDIAAFYDNVILELDEETFNILLQRYKEIERKNNPKGYIYYDVDTYIIETATSIINFEWLEERFKKYLISLNNKEDVQKIKEELAQTFPSLPQKQQKYAIILLNEIDNGIIKLESNKKFIDYLNDYIKDLKDTKILKFSKILGIDAELVEEKLLIYNSNDRQQAIRKETKEKSNKETVKAYFEEKEGKEIDGFSVNLKLSSLIEEFFESNGEMEI